VNDEDPDAERDLLVNAGFRQGFARTWIERATYRFTIVFAMEFETKAGAKRWFEAQVLGSKLDPEFEDAAAPSTIPDAAAFTQRLEQEDGVYEGEFVIFANGYRAWILGVFSPEGHPLPGRAGELAVMQYQKG
jgi:hypothetical protein